MNLKINLITVHTAINLALAPDNKEIAPVEKGMHTNGFRYKKCTHLTVGTGNVYLNPG